MTTIGQMRFFIHSSRRPILPALVCLVFTGCVDSGEEDLSTASGGAPSASGAGGASGGQVAGTGGGVGVGGQFGSGGTLLGSGGTNGPGGGAMTGGVDGSGASNSGTGGDGSGGAAGPSLPPTTDYSAPGPFATTIDSNVGPDGGYKVFRPETLGEGGFLHAPIIFGPGITQSVDVHTEMLTNFASHGFVVVGTPVLTERPGADSNREKMQAGLDWILEQNDTTGIYEGKLWVDHAVSMGFSVGGTAAVQIGGDPAVLTVVSIHGHAAEAELHGTMLQTTGTDDPVGMPLQEDTYEMSQVPTFLATLTGAPHSYIEKNGGGDERPAIVAWMRYWIYGDTGAEEHFFGDDCVLCMSPWENPRRKNWN